MRVCIVSQEYPPGYVGGIGTQSRVKAQGLAALGHEVEVLTAGQETGPPLASSDDGAVRLHQLRIPGGEFAVYRTETYWLGYTWAVLGALRALAETRALDVVDFPDYGAEGLAFQLDRQEDDPAAVVVHLHGSLGMFAEQIGWPEREDQLYRLGTAMEELSITNADRLIAASRSIAEFTATRAGVPLEQIDVVEGAVDTEVFSPGDPTARSDADRIRLLFVGNLVENKGVHTVFDAFMRLAPSHPGLSLLIAGSGDEEIGERMRHEAAAAGLGERLSILGFVEHSQLPRLYRSADVLAAPSQYEGGLGMVYLEAMASGLPVVATAAGGAAESVRDGETGILLGRGDADEATAAIETLIGDPALRRRLGAAGRRRAEQRFSVERYAQRVADAYERAIERRRSAVRSAW
jgi:glycosyltransferase involved in cell wall biosynthesis